VTNVIGGRKKAGSFRKTIFESTKNDLTNEYEIRLNNEIKEFMVEDEIVKTLNERKMNLLG